MKLRTRFAIWVGLFLSCGLVVFGTVTYFSMARGLQAAIDDSLRLNASQAVSTIDIENSRIDFADSLPDGRLLAELTERGLTIRVLNPTGNILHAFGAYQNLPVTSESLYTAQNHLPFIETLYIYPEREPVRVFTTPIVDQGELIGIIQVTQSLKSMQDTLRRLLTTLFAGTPLLVIAAALGSYFLTSRVLSPIDQITRTAQRISAEDLSTRLDLPDTHDEVSRLANTFDHMLARLEDAFRRERQFTSDASHELRTPLAGMQAILSVVGRERRTLEDYEMALVDLTEETNRLQNLTENMLSLARGETHKPADREPVDLTTLLHDLAEAMHPLAESKKLLLNCTVPAGMVTSGNYDDLLRLFVNLLDNSIKFTEKGEILIAGWCEEHTVNVEITDTGTGIPPEHQAHIFDRFYRVESSRSTPGSGLGLAIAKEIAHAHGGVIEVSSEVGKGTTFRVILPISSKNRCQS